MSLIQVSLLCLMLVLQLNQVVWCAPSMFGDVTNLKTRSGEDRLFLSRPEDSDYADNNGLRRLINTFGKMGGMFVIPNQKGEPTIIDGDSLSRFFLFSQSKSTPEVEFKGEVSKKQLKKNPRDILRGLAVKRDHFY